jgi:hypothetical protein
VSVKKILVIVFTLFCILMGYMIAGAEEVATPSLTIGLPEQSINDITLTESAPEIFAAPGQILLKAPAGVTFSATPIVTVTDGDLQIDASGVGIDTTSANEGLILIKVKSSSNKPSTIKISSLKLTIDRTVPEGDIFLKVGGSSLIENNIDAFPNSDWVTEIAVAKVITPAPEDTKTTTVFKIDDPKYTVNNVEKNSDVAPYIKEARTYLPLRLVAEAVGISDDNIIWNANEQSVILLKGGRSVKLVIGNSVMIINGMPITIDAAPEIVEPGCTMLPLRAVAQALDCYVQWDATTQTVTVN